MKNLPFITFCIVATSVTVNLITINNTLSAIKENTAQQYCVDVVDENEITEESVEG